MLLDLTFRHPEIDPDLCPTSLVVRVRHVNERDVTRAVRWAGTLEAMPSTAYTVEPIQSFTEGHNQRIHDYLLQTPETTTLKVGSFIPHSDKPWELRSFWISLCVVGGPVPTRHPLVLLRSGKQSLVINFRDYNSVNVLLPPAPTFTVTGPSPLTFWERLLE